LNILAQAKIAVGGDWSRIVQVVRLGGFVACTPSFTDAPKVVNGASDLMVNLFGPAGTHARAAIGVASLPADVSVEVEAMFEIKP
jgi:enamine deaminase RidA (YjgF/YER057c/UK114 family)